MTAPSRTGASLYDRFSGIVDQQGLCVALVTAEQTITYVALRTAIDNCAIVLAGKGIRQGQVIAAQFSRPELYLIALLAANRLGAGMMLCPLAAVGTTGVRPDWLLSDDRVPVANRAGALVDGPDVVSPRRTRQACRAAGPRAMMSPTSSAHRARPASASS